MNLNCGFFKFQLENRFGEKNQDNPNTTQICFKLTIHFKFCVT